MKSVTASMAGTVFRVLVKTGDEVQAGQDVMILESMKMEVPVQTESAGSVTKIRVSEGEFVNEGDVLLDLS